MRWIELLPKATINYLSSIEFRLPSEYLYYLKNRQDVADVMAQRVEKCHDNLFSQIYKNGKYEANRFELFKTSQLYQLRQYAAQ